MARAYKRVKTLPPNWWSSELRRYFDTWCLDMRQGMQPYTPVTARTFERRFILYTRLGWESSPPDCLDLDEVMDLANVYRVLSHYSIESFSNRHNMLYSLISFAKFLVRMEVLPESKINQLRQLRPKRVIPPRKTVLKDQHEVQRLKQAIQHKVYEGEYSRHLDTAIVETMLYTGIRNAELCSLNIADIDFTQQVMTIRLGKGRKTRRVGLSAAIIQILRDYLEVRQQKVKQEHDALFLNRRGTRIKTADITRRFLKLARQADLDITPHGLRRTFATIRAEAGKPLHIIQKALGHSDIRTTQGYLMSDEQAVIDEMKGWD